MDKYTCTVCGYEYNPEVGDPDNGIEPGTAFEDLPEDWVCPLCGMPKDAFKKAEQLTPHHCTAAGDDSGFICRTVMIRSLICGIIISRKGVE